MCDACLNPAFSAGARVSLSSEALIGLKGREQIARLLTMADGVCPDLLIANTLDEEPLDGVLACGQEARFSWRDRLQRADQMDRLPMRARGPALQVGG